jgi:hypothetical protein
LSFHHAEDKEDDPADERDEGDENPPVFFAPRATVEGGVFRFPWWVTLRRYMQWLIYMETIYP